MATKTVFVGEESEMECYINEKGQLYIWVGQLENEAPYGAPIELDKQDTLKLIKTLTELVQDMPD